MRSRVREVKGQKEAGRSMVVGRIKRRLNCCLINSRREELRD